MSLLATSLGTSRISAPSSTALVPPSSTPRATPRLSSAITVSNSSLSPLLPTKTGLNLETKVSSTPSGRLVLEGPVKKGNSDIQTRALLNLPSKSETPEFITPSAAASSPVGLLCASSVIIGTVTASPVIPFLGCTLDALTRIGVEASTSTDPSNSSSTSNSGPDQLLVAVSVPRNGLRDYARDFFVGFLNSDWRINTQVSPPYERCDLNNIPTYQVAPQTDTRVKQLRDQSSILTPALTTLIRFNGDIALARQSGQTQLDQFSKTLAAVADLGIAIRDLNLAGIDTSAITAMSSVLKGLSDALKGKLGEATPGTAYNLDSLNTALRTYIENNYYSGGNYPCDTTVTKAPGSCGSAPTYTPDNSDTYRAMCCDLLVLADRIKGIFRDGIVTPAQDASSAVTLQAQNATNQTSMALVREAQTYNSSGRLRLLNDYNYIVVPGNPNLGSVTGEWNLFATPASNLSSSETLLPQQINLFLGEFISFVSESATTAAKLGVMKEVLGQYLPVFESVLSSIAGSLFSEYMGIVLPVLAIALGRGNAIRKKNDRILPRIVEASKFSSDLLTIKMEKAKGFSKFLSETVEIKVDQGKESKGGASTGTIAMASFVSPAETPTSPLSARPFLNENAASSLTTPDNKSSSSSSSAQSSPATAAISNVSSLLIGSPQAKSANVVASPEVAATLLPSTAATDTSASSSSSASSASSGSSSSTATNTSSPPVGGSVDTGAVKLPQ